MKKFIDEVNRQLSLKSEVTCVGPPHVILNGPELLEAIREAENDAFKRGMMHSSVPKDRVSVHGTDGCIDCDDGRITIYAGSRQCLECMRKRSKEN